ncbi:MAG: hypothetical protein R2795_05800 [Saprospiraceae bacterium]
MRNLKILLFLFIIGISNYSNACTIFCGKDKHGNVWAGNNEDNIFSFYNYINVFPKTPEAKFGYFTLSYHTPENGENVLVQGGMNEAGLFYDFNTLDMSGREYIIHDLDKKKKFPKGDAAILSHLLANFETVEEVVAFFEVYWFEIGFKGAQMHIADKNGHFAMIDPTGSKILTNETYQLSTNFSICGNEETYGCWRFPIAKDILDKNEPGFDVFRDISEKTAQRGYISTIYTNIQNLNTGDIWFYFALDYEHPYKTNIKALLAQGRKSYLLRELFPNNPISEVYNSYVAEGGEQAFKKFNNLELPPNSRDAYLAAFVNNQIASDYDMEALPFLEEYLKTNPIGHWMTGARAICYFNHGNKSKAIEIIKEYKNRIPETSMDVEAVLAKFEGVFPADANTTIELNGHQDATNVFVIGLQGGVYDFMIKKDGRWMTKVHLPEGIYNYQFVVDGKKVLDSQTPVYTNVSAFNASISKLHRIGVNTSMEKYEKTIRVTVPNKEDEVYIAGDQPNLANWNSVFRLKRISDFEREITVDVHLPAKFKFTRGNWDAEAIVEGQAKAPDGGLLPLELDIKSLDFSFRIINWKDRMK